MEMPVTFGLGKNTEILEATIKWPDGKVQKIKRKLAINKLHTVEEDL